MILNQPWFRRAWIFQEASLVQRIFVQYDSLEVLFADFNRLFDAVSLLESAVGIQKRRGLATDIGGFEMIQLIHETRQRLSEPHSARALSPGASKFLSTLFQVLRRVEAFDPRDLIFTFLTFQGDEGITAT
jgi:hypothetical protein